MEPDAGVHLRVFEVHFQCVWQGHPAPNKAVGVSFPVAAQQHGEGSGLCGRWEEGGNPLFFKKQKELTCDLCLLKLLPKELNYVLYKH